MFKFLNSIFANLILAILISLFTGLPVYVTFAFTIGLGILMRKVSKQFNGKLAFDGLATQVWLPDVLPSQFYPENNFLSAVRDLSSLVENNTINLAEAGADPDVLVNNTVYPVPITDVTDVPREVQLKTYDTTNSVVRNAIAIELAYDQRMLYIDKHQKALLKKFGKDAAWAYAPQVNDATKFNNVLSLGGNDSVIDAFIDQQAYFGSCNAPSEDWVSVLDFNHMAKIAKEDKVLYKAIMAKPGEIFYGFKIYTYSQLPFYLQADNTKAALGVAYNPEIHKRSSIFFLGSEVIKAMGTLEFFSRLKDPEARGDIFGYQARFTASSFRNKYMGAILQ